MYLCSCVRWTWCVYVYIVHTETHCAYVFLTFHFKCFAWVCLFWIFFRRHRYVRTCVRTALTRFLSKHRTLKLWHFSHLNTEACASFISIACYESCGFLMLFFFYLKKIHTKISTNVDWALHSNNYYQQHNYPNIVLFSNVVLKLNLKNHFYRLETKNVPSFFFFSNILFMSALNDGFYLAFIVLDSN